MGGGSALDCSPFDCGLYPGSGAIIDPATDKVIGQLCSKTTDRSGNLHGLSQRSLLVSWQSLGEWIWTLSQVHAREEQERGIGKGGVRPWNRWKVGAF
jgi:hypothetical protein